MPYLKERLLIEQNVSTTVTTNKNTNQQLFESQRYSRRRDKSPSESSVDSTVDIFDQELRQKYMRAVAYLRILDEAPINEHEEHVNVKSSRSNISENVDIELVIKQARKVAQMNANSNPDKARRILEKAYKLEVSLYK